MTGRHVELRLVGDPDALDATLTAIATTVELTRGTRKPTRERDGRVVQYATVTAPNRGRD